MRAKVLRKIRTAADKKRTRRYHRNPHVARHKGHATSAVEAIVAWRNHNVALARLRAATGDPLLVRAGRGLVPMLRVPAPRDRVHTLAREVLEVIGPQDASVDLATLK